MSESKSQSMVAEIAKELLIEVYARAEVEEPESDFSGLSVPESVSDEVIQPIVEKIKEGFELLDGIWGENGRDARLEDIVSEDKEVLLTVVGSLMEYDFPNTNDRLMEAFVEHGVSWPGTNQRLESFAEELNARFDRALYDLPWEWPLAENAKTDELEESAMGEAQIYQDLVQFMQKNASKPGSVAQTIYFAAQDAFSEAPGDVFDDWMTRFLRFLATRV